MNKRHQLIMSSVSNLGLLGVVLLTVQPSEEVRPEYQLRSAPEVHVTSLSKLADLEAGTAEIAPAQSVPPAPVLERPSLVVPVPRGVKHGPKTVDLAFEAQSKEATVSAPMVTGLDEEVPEPPRSVKLLAGDILDLHLDIDAGFRVFDEDAKDVQHASSSSVSVWPMFGNEYRVSDFEGYCQVVAYSESAGRLWAPALEVTEAKQSEVSPALQASLSDPLLRGFSGLLPAEGDLFGWVVCMEAVDGGAVPFEVNSALSRLNGVTLGEPSTLSVSSGNKEG